MPRKYIPTPRYESTHPPHLATAAELETEGLKPARDQPTAGLFRVRTRDRTSLSALYERRLAVPLEPQPEAS